MIFPFNFDFNGFYCLAVDFLTESVFVAYRAVYGRLTGCYTIPLILSLIFKQFCIVVNVAYDICY